MAQYPAGNPGQYPLDPATDVGQVRLLFGDTISTAYSPEVEDHQNYEYFSDAEIESFLALADGSQTRAIGFAWVQLSGAAALESKSVKDYDLSVDLTKRAADLRATAQFWFDRADAEDDADGNGDIFDMHNLVGPCDIIPEGLIPEYGRHYTTGRIR